MTLPTWKNTGRTTAWRPSAPRAGCLTTGELTSLFSYVMGVLMSLMMRSMVFVMVTMSAASAHRIAEVLTETPDLTSPANAVHDITDGSIDFDHVNFCYKHGSTGEDTLHDIDLHIKSGETSGSILDNLRWGKEDATEEECRQACIQAQTDEFIQRLPDGYNTHIEQGGSNVSGGQKQRLCIARALLKKPKVLILDDSTSAVDTATDARIREAFAQAIPGTTKLIIAQRFSSVQNADRIVVLDDGRISDVGTHDQLIAQKGRYYQLYTGNAIGA